MKNKILLILLIVLASPVFGQYQVTKLIKDKPVFGYIDPAHTQDLNNTRKVYGANELQRDAKLDSLALTRCLRYAKLIMGNTEYLTNLALALKEVHKGYEGLYERENATQLYCGAGFGKSQFGGLTADMVTPKIKDRKYIPGIAYNNSNEHRETRISTKWKKFGSATGVIYVMMKDPNYDPNSTSMEYQPKAVFINYEVFE